MEHYGIMKAWSSQFSCQTMINQFTGIIKIDPRFMIAER